ncbi:DUF4956 domain-containing protein [Desulfoplanes formicivorans]|uniref:DUF4956 domain-containing protein n=1 Tax=Desulfoplanes formicivorans TaxID=1592317 RepID=A0A194AGQ7_9BACT|nr:DUF4956 domain-containing protein [Desulfoplanes formicivorans]GAU08266.1 hypothetical protein DPF_0969 [Desulfoplanes formicivorans]
MKIFFATPRFYALAIITSFISPLAVSQVMWALSKGRIHEILPRVAGAAAVGLLIGWAYYALCSFFIRKNQAINQKETWKGLALFHLSFLASWLYVLPFIPARFGDFFAALIFTAGTSKLLAMVYQEFGTSLSNRVRFAGNFVVLACTTMLVISVVKTSLALSLGLVGALSIVRFRTAIKDPEELAFLFLNIALGLGFGSGQVAYTMIGFIGIILAFVWSRAKKNVMLFQQSYLAQISLPEAPLDFDALLEKAVLSVSPRFEIKRIDESGSTVDATLLVELNGPPTKLIRAIKDLLPGSRVSITHAQGLV